MIKFYIKTYAKRTYFSQINHIRKKNNKSTDENIGRFSFALYYIKNWGVFSNFFSGMGGMGINNLNDDNNIHQH